MSRARTCKHRRPPDPLAAIRLDELMRDRGMSSRQVADGTAAHGPAISWSTVERARRAVCTPTYRAQRQIALALGCRPGQIWGTASGLPGDDHQIAA